MICEFTKKKQTLEEALKKKLFRKTSQNSQENKFENMFEFLITTGTTIIMLIMISLIILGKKENSKFAAPLFLYFTVRSYVNVHNHNPYIF